MSYAVTNFRLPLPYAAFSAYVVGGPGVSYIPIDGITTCVIITMEELLSNCAM
jgi:hypothetical protein